MDVLPAATAGCLFLDAKLPLTFAAAACVTGYGLR